MSFNKKYVGFKKKFEFPISPTISKTFVSYFINELYLMKEIIIAFDEDCKTKK